MMRALLSWRNHGKRSRLCNRMNLNRLFEERRRCRLYDMYPLWRINTGARIVSQNMKKNSYIRENHFHGRNAVAPLKRDGRSLLALEVPEFPRQKCRGPIEAVRF